MTLLQVNHPPAGCPGLGEGPPPDESVTPAPRTSPAMDVLSDELQRQATLDDTRAQHVGLYVPGCSLSQANKNVFSFYIRLSTSVTVYYVRVIVILFCSCLNNRARCYPCNVYSKQSCGLCIGAQQK